MHALLGSERQGSTRYPRQADGTGGFVLRACLKGDTRRHIVVLNPLK
jgi:hypothetical protein